MTCDKLLMEALDSITFTYKLDSVINKLPAKGKMTASQLDGYLRKRGVSPKEIKASGILDTVKDKAMPNSYWAGRIKSGNHHINTTDAKNLTYSDITLGQNGIGSETYKETLSTIKEPYEYEPVVTHFDDEIRKINKRPSNNELETLQRDMETMDIDDPDLPWYVKKIKEIKLKNKRPYQTLLGWRRTHEQVINDKPTTVLNEFQSDWAQSERSGRGVFKKNIFNSDTEKLESEKAKLKKQYTMYSNELDALPAETIDGIPIEKTKEFEDLFNSYKDTYTAYANIKDKINSIKAKDIIADFPMSETKHHQFQIVGAINEAIKNGTNRVAIPIERQNELYGTEGVTKFYNSLNKKILPEIRKKLEKQGMRLKISKESYKGTFNLNAEDSIKNNIMDVMGSDWFNANEKSINEEIRSVVIDGKEPTSRYVKDAINYLGNDIKTAGNNTLHIIDIVPVKGKKIQWDVYSMLGAIGLSGLADKLKEKESN